jgi:hypothetical protein
MIFEGVSRSKRALELGLVLAAAVATASGACDGDKRPGGMMTAGSVGHGGGSQMGTGGAGGTPGSSTGSGGAGACAAPNDPALAAAAALFTEGRTTFRYDTFGDEAFWGDALQLHLAIAGAANHGVGPGVSPATALAVGLKVDVDAIPDSLANDIVGGNVDLDDPANTLALIKLNAVVGITGFFDAGNRITAMGIQCALCHSTVDDSLLPGIGKRLDGWANRDLNVGAIIALSPNLTPFTQLLQVDEATVKAVLGAWGPGRFDAELALDGQGFRPSDNKTAATLLPPAFGLAGVALHTWTGWGSVTHWNAFVANLEMMGKGTFHDERLNNPKFPVAVRNGFAHVTKTPDLITPKLAQLHFYQLGLKAPPAPAGSFDAGKAAKGKAVFEGKARCAGCHVPPTFSEPGWPMHTAAEIGIDDFQAKRSPDERYRTSPLAGLRTHTKGGFYHDGRFATLADVIEHYNGHFHLDLTSDEKLQLAEYLMSL